METHVNDRDAWQDEIVMFVQSGLSLGRKDASDIVEAEQFLLAQSWADDLTASQVAHKIINKNILD